jgi:hypothetical protein
VLAAGRRAPPEVECFALQLGISAALAKGCQKLVVISDSLPVVESLFFFFFFFFFLIYNVVLDRSPRAHNTNSAYSKTTLRIAHYYTTKRLGTSFWRANTGRNLRIFQDNVALSSGEKVEAPPPGPAHTIASHQIALGRSPDRNPPQRAGQSPEGVNSP